MLKMFQCEQHEYIMKKQMNLKVNIKNYLK